MGSDGDDGRDGPRFLSSLFSLWHGWPTVSSCHYEKKRPSYAKKRERRGKNLPAGLEAIAGLVSCGSVDLANGH